MLESLQQWKGIDDGTVPYLARINPDVKMSLLAGCHLALISVLQALAKTNFCILAMFY